MSQKSKIVFDFFPTSTSTFMVTWYSNTGITRNCTKLLNYPSRPHTAFIFSWICYFISHQRAHHPPDPLDHRCHSKFWILYVMPCWRWIPARILSFTASSVAPFATRFSPCSSPRGPPNDWGKIYRTGKTGDVEIVDVNQMDDVDQIDGVNESANRWSR